MKKLFIFFAAVALTAMSTNVFAQSTGTTPAPGATHNYSITDNGNTVNWLVTRGDLTEPAGDDAIIDDSGEYSIAITWASDLIPGTWYYIHVIESDGTCSNEKVLPVHITASPFSLEILADQTTTQCYDSPVSVSIGATPDVIEYNHGTATLTYTITPVGIDNSSYNSGGTVGYEFNFTTDLPTANHVTTPTILSGSATLSGNTVTVSDLNSVQIQFVVDNQNVYNNTNDAEGTAADFNLEVGINSGITGNGVSDNGSGVYNADTDVARPHTSGIETN